MSATGINMKESVFPFQHLTCTSTILFYKLPVPSATTLLRRSSIHATPTPAPATIYARSTGRAALMRSTVSHIYVFQVGLSTVADQQLRFTESVKCRVTVILSVCVCVCFQDVN